MSRQGFLRSKGSEQETKLATKSPILAVTFAKRIAVCGQALACPMLSFQKHLSWFFP